VTGAVTLLTLVSDRRRLPGRELPALAREAAEAGVDRIQVREKDLPGRSLHALVTDIVAAASGTATRVLVNGRPDVAVAAGAHGVHLPEEGLPLAATRRAFPGLEVGASRHSVEGARRAEDEGADFVFLGPIFATPGKEHAALGLGPLEEAARSLRIPVHAVGGIDASTARLAIEAGARGLAAIRVFLQGPIAETVRALRGAGHGL
jgi:thiamine-phosphate pyrophosphorylase